MRQFFKIGEISTIFHIPIETLRYYDHIGLLTPARVADNGYRLYSPDQFERISTILMLRNADVSIERIQALLQAEQTEEALDILAEQRSNLAQHICSLNKLQHKLDTIDAQLRFADQQKPLEIQSLPPLYLISLPFRHDTDNEGDLDIHGTMDAHRLMDVNWLQSSSVFSSLDKKNIENNDYHLYETYGVLSENVYPGEHPLLRILPAQDWIVAHVMVCTLNHTEVEAVYSDMLAFATAAGKKMNGSALERTVFDLEPGGHGQHIHYFTLMIPV